MFINGLGLYKIYIYRSIEDREKLVPEKLTKNNSEETAAESPDKEKLSKGEISLFRSDHKERK